MSYEYLCIVAFKRLKKYRGFVVRTLKTYK